MPTNLAFHTCRLALSNFLHVYFSSPKLNPKLLVAENVLMKTLCFSKSWLVNKGQNLRFALLLLEGRSTVVGNTKALAPHWDLSTSRVECGAQTRTYALAVDADYLILVPALPRSSPSPPVIAAKLTSIKCWITDQQDTKCIYLRQWQCKFMRGLSPFAVLHLGTVGIYRVYMK